MNLKYDFTQNESASIALPYASKVHSNLDQLEAKFGDLDAIVLTSKDQFISEYVPLANMPRFGATAFTGSVGDAIYWSKKGRAQTGTDKSASLFVDGRYHLQADRECPAEIVEVVKLDVEPNIEGGIRERLSKHKGLKVGLDFERTSIAAIEKYREALATSGSKLVHVNGDDILKALGLPGWKTDRTIFSIPKTATGRTPAATLFQLKQDMVKRAGHSDVLHFTAATDDAAFLLNARGFHLPNTGSFLAYTFFAGNEIILFLPECSKNSKVELDSAQFNSPSAGTNGMDIKLTVIRNNLEELKSTLKKHSVKTAFYNSSVMNALLPSLVQEVFPEVVLQSDYRWVLLNRVRKTPEEMQSIREAFIHSSKAIAKTLRWGKAQPKISEVDLANYLYQSYADEGAVALSFKTISGAGPNSAIVHYSTPSQDCIFKKGDLALLDSGAYYSNGFCTDCTRGYFANANDSSVKPANWQREIYTATLKAAIQVFMEPVDAKLSGKEVDAMIRNQVKAAGYDYMHGTGHGVGIHVHEEGIRLSTLSIYPQSPYACVSVEPGIYLKDKGGVRVENIALLQPVGSPDQPSAYRYENVVFVGYDWDLIDLTKLADEEKAYLKDYEAKCRELGTELTACPL